MPLQPVDIVSETGVMAEEMEPIGKEAAALIQQLAETGISPERVASELRRIRPTRQDRRQARRSALNDRIQKETGGLLARCNISPGGKSLDRSYQKTNFQWVLAELNHRINSSASQQQDNRQNFTLDELDRAHQAIDEVVSNCPGITSSFYSLRENAAARFPSPAARKSTSDSSFSGSGRRVAGSVCRNVEVISGQLLRELEGELKGG